MNVFEDLIVELKENNLLESTVIETDQSDDTAIDVTMDFAVEEFDDTATAELNDDAVTDLEKTPGAANADAKSESRAKSIKDNDFYRKRAVSEVSSLQMVEHVLTGVEREYMKIVPKTFDDLNAKKALHSFLNADSNSAEHSAAEFTLLQETEAWCTVLGERDSSIPVSSLRLFCENSKPALSSQALVGLARFYRNLPYSEQRRSKFDFTITRLFSRPSEDEARACLFDRDEMLVHINTLYKEWSSVPLYSAEHDDSKLLLTALSFEDLAHEAEQAPNFDQLITSDFFNRLRLFKESISELFFAPNVTAAAIECNIRIGNAYVNLIHRERAKMNEESLESKYGDLNDQAVSDAAARTLQLVDLLRGPAATQEHEREIESEEVPVRKESAESHGAAQFVKPDQPAKDLPPFLARLRENAFSVNKWFLAGSILMIALSVGVWVWANYVVEQRVSTAGVDVVALEGTVMAEHIKTARVSSGMFYGLLEPTWDTLPKEKRQEFVQKVLQAGQAKGFDQVTLLGKEGKMAAFASPTRLDIIMP